MIIYERVILKICTLDEHPFSQVKQNSFSFAFFLCFFVFLSQLQGLLPSGELTSWASESSQKDLILWLSSLYPFSQNKKTSI